MEPEQKSAMCLTEEKDCIEENGETGEKLRALAEEATQEDLIRDMSLLLRLERELSNASFPALALEAGLLRICHFPQALPLAEMLARLTALEKRLDTAPVSGADGGRVIAEGTIDQIRDNPDSLIAPF